MEPTKTNTLIIAFTVLSCTYLVTAQTTTTTTTPRPPTTFEPLKQSDLLRAKALVRWLVNNRTENGTTTFNAGFIRLAFHDCVGGCDGCLNLRNPSNAGLNFYKTPLDMMYNDFVFPTMSRADWYAIAGVTAVEYAAERTPCNGWVCIPPINFKWGRKDCLNEDQLFRRFPGPDNDPRDTIRRTFRMNLLEITALMGAHTLGKNHGSGATWVTNETNFDNQYYKDLIDAGLKWRKGLRQGALNTWSHGDTGENIMLTSDFFMGFDVGTNFGDCNNNPIVSCAKSTTYSSVERFAEDNDYWLTNFGAAFSVMINSGNFGKLKSVVFDTFNETFTGVLFPPTNKTENATELANETSSSSTFELDISIQPVISRTASLLNSPVIQPLLSTINNTNSVTVAAANDSTTAAGNAAASTDNATSGVNQGSSDTDSSPLTFHRGTEGSETSTTLPTTSNTTSITQPTTGNTTSITQPAPVAGTTATEPPLQVTADTTEQVTPAVTNTSAPAASQVTNSTGLPVPAPVDLTTQAPAPVTQNTTQDSVTVRSTPVLTPPQVHIEFNEQTSVTTRGPTISGPTISGPTASRPTTRGPTTSGPTTSGPSASGPTTSGPTTSGPTTSGPTTSGPTTSGPTTSGPTTSGPTTSGLSARGPTTSRPRVGYRPTLSLRRLRRIRKQRRRLLALARRSKRRNRSSSGSSDSSSGSSDSSG